LWKHLWSARWNFYKAFCRPVTLIDKPGMVKRKACWQMADALRDELQRFVIERFRDKEWGGCGR